MKFIRKESELLSPLKIRWLLTTLQLVLISQNSIYFHHYFELKSATIPLFPKMLISNKINYHTFRRLFLITLFLLIGFLDNAHFMEGGELCAQESLLAQVFYFMNEKSFF